MAVAEVALMELAPSRLEYLQQTQDYHNHKVSKTACRQLSCPQDQKTTCYCPTPAAAANIRQCEPPGYPTVHFAHRDVCAPLTRRPTRNSRGCWSPGQFHHARYPLECISPSAQGSNQTCAINHS